MFKPLAYNDNSAINKPTFLKDYSTELTIGNGSIGKRLVQSMDNIVKAEGKAVVLIDGYASSNFNLTVNLINQYVKEYGHIYKFISMEDIYKSQMELDELFKGNLPPKSPEDPVSLFGKLFEGSFKEIFDENKLEKVIDYIKKSNDDVIILYGHGAAADCFRVLSNWIIYIDITPKTAAIRAREGKYHNIGDSCARPFSELMRRNYFADFEIIVNLRKKLLQENLINEYICGDNEERLVMLENEAFNGILKELSRYPFRCKPVYLEGVWGGEYIRKVRNLDIDSKNIAWIFEMIPMEVSVLVKYNKEVLEFPFSTFFEKYPCDIMGEECTKRFNGYFPIRCNYDDTFHSNGNMSIQVHPDEKFVKEHYNEKGSQDEAYYVIATGHNAKTYVGFKEDADTDEFFNLTAKSEEDGNNVDYQKYINYIPSTPGRQIMIPAGTIHSSGQNQFILELGSLTIGSYTYKIYDYNRKDGDGNKRPIHSIYGKKVVDTTRRAAWVNENIAIEPILIDSGKGYKEFIVGNTELMYYETRRLELETGHKASFKNNNQFTILTLVDGEKVKVYSKTNPEFCYEQDYLNIVIVPASIDEYIIENLGYQPVVVHKVMLK
jgi:mannose-6-phosphate isomerase class I